MIPLRDNVRSRKTPYMTFGLIAVCTFIYLYQFLLGAKDSSAFIYDYGFIPANKEDLYPFFTSIFLHGSWFHLLSNMWFLWIFGDNVEDRMGHFWFLFFYIICGVVSNLSHMLFNMDSMIPAVGASGAIAGVIGAYYKLYPRASVKTLIPVFILLPLIINVPASLFIIIWFVTQVYSGAVHSLGGGGAVGGVAWWAHTGGFIAGYLFHRLFVKKVGSSRYYDIDF